MDYLPSGELSILGDQRKLTHREWIWVWLKVKHDGLKLPPDQFDTPTMRAEMAKHFDESPLLRIELSDQLRPQMHDIDLEWISDDDDEQLSWIRNHLDDAKLKHERLARRRSPGISHIYTEVIWSRRDAVIAAIDYWDEALTAKELVVEGLRIGWDEHIQRERKFRWFTKENELEQCDLTWAWLRKNKPHLTTGQRPFTTRADVQDFFDAIELSDDEEKFIINTIKLRWSQRKHREKMVGKKQCNLILSNAALKSLDKFANQKNLSRSQFIEILLHEEAERSRGIKK
ncbi:hypothetical protein [Paraburkholderia gardini]|uniref:hypothetical protein n=1 Tax=Paraburkholderia gardini TaxID=2823469 RepID=UPI001E1AE606|nr:hypothetical protein [Paraburkholderia gardini]CAG4892677.1 hypothetical protein R69919_01434 [Paraburkholderia gardini]